MDPVIVAGAGPTGLALALCLARHDVPVVLLDEGTARDEPPHPERTVVLRPETAALLSRIGYPAVHTDAARWTAWRTLRRRREVQRVRFDDDGDGLGAAAPTAGPAARLPERLPAVRSGRTWPEEPDAPDEESSQVWGGPSPLHLPQHRLCQALRTALAGQPLVTVAHGSRLDVIEQDAHGISVHTRDTDGTGPAGGAQDTWWRGSYLVGCDGPRSTVRKLLEVRFPGRTAVERYAVAALRVDLPEPRTALLHRDPPGNRGAETTARPLRDRLWRIDWSLRRSAPPLTADALVAGIRGALASWCDGSVPAYELLGSSEYAVHQRLALRWRTGRAFLAGDAAHLLGVLGTQGVEEGLRDAGNLAWKLAVAWHQGASDTLLDSYQSERRGAVGLRLRAADQALPLVRAKGAVRSLVSGSASRHAHLLSDGHLGRGRLGAAPVHARSPLLPPASRGGRSASAAGVVGALVDDVPVTDLDGVRGRLWDRLGRGLLAVLVAPGTGVWESRHWLTAGLMPQLSSAVAALPTRAELLVTESYPGAAAHTVLLVRPDGHLVAAMTGCRPADLHAYADLARGGPPDDFPASPDPEADPAPAHTTHG
jgi:3-(3-hydroxy-phenyl)propionate hydroxylase